MYKSGAATGIVLWFHCGKLLGKLAEGQLSAVDATPWYGKGPARSGTDWNIFRQRDEIRAWD
jgi:hypothetical protein